MSFVRLPTAGVSILLGAFCALLLYGLAILTTGGTARAASPFPATAALTAPELPALTLASADDTSAAAEKPLFHVDRKPFTGRSAAAAGKDSDADTSGVAPFTLKGVLLADGMARASLSSNSGGDIRWVNRGDAIDGWKLVQVAPGNVVLARGDYRTTLALYPARAGYSPE